MRVVASFTTIPSRIKNLEPALTSLVRQTKTLDHIYLSLPRRSLKPGEEQIAYELPAFLQKSVFSNTVSIVWLEYDYGPVCKLFGGWLSEHDPNTCIIILDDDVCYSCTMVEKLVRWTSRYPHAAIGFSGWRFLEEPPYIRFELNGVKNATNPSICRFSSEPPFVVDMLCGCGAIMIKRGFIPEIDVLKQWSRNPCLRCVDDVTISACLSQNEVQRLLIRGDTDGYLLTLPNPLSASQFKAVWKHLSAYRYLRNNYSNVFREGCAFWQNWTLAFLVVLLLLIIFIACLLLICTGRRSSDQLKNIS